MLGNVFEGILESHADTLRVGIIQIIEHPALDATRNGIMDALAEQGYIKDENLIVYFQSAQGSPVIASQIAQQFAGMKLNAVVAIGTTAAQMVASKLEEGKVPIVFSSVTDPKGAGLVQNYKTPERNVTGVSNFVPVLPQLQFFQKLVPGLNKLGIIYNPGEANSVALNERIEAAARKIGMTIVLAPAIASVEVASAAQSLVGKVNALLVTNDNTALSAFDSIIRVADQAKMPVFVSDVDQVSRGAVGALGPNQYEIGKQTGNMVVKILKGEKVSQLPVEFPLLVESYINVRAMKRLGLQKVLEALQLPVDKDILKEKITINSGE